MNLTLSSTIWSIGPPVRLSSRGKEGPLERLQASSDVSMSWWRKIMHHWSSRNRGQGRKGMERFRCPSINRVSENCSVQFSSTNQKPIHCFIGCHVTNSCKLLHHLADTWGTLHGQRYRRRGASAPDTWRTYKRSSPAWEKLKFGNGKCRCPSIFLVPYPVQNWARAKGKLQTKGLKCRTL